MEKNKFKKKKKISREKAEMEKTLNYRIIIVLIDAVFMKLK